MCRSAQGLTSPASRLSAPAPLTAPAGTGTGPRRPAAVGRSGCRRPSAAAPSVTPPPPAACAADCSPDNIQNRTEHTYCSPGHTEQNTQQTADCSVFTRSQSRKQFMFSKQDTTYSYIHLFTSHRTLYPPIHKSYNTEHSTQQLFASSHTAQLSDIKTT